MRELGGLDVAYTGVDAAQEELTMHTKAKDTAQGKSEMNAEPQVWNDYRLAKYSQYQGGTDFTKQRDQVKVYRIV